jgi:hypothetical protein
MFNFAAQVLLLKLGLLGASFGFIQVQGLLAEFEVTHKPPLRNLSKVSPSAHPPALRQEQNAPTDPRAAAAKSALDELSE